jgi:pimeloyl-ACP methyl ester carboxylesterase
VLEDPGPARKLVLSDDRMTRAGELMSLVMLLLGVLGQSSLGLQSDAPASALDPVSRTVEVLGVRLHYLDWGGSGDALVFLPAGCETAHIYGDIAPAFTDRFRVIGLTTRGCGQSGRADAYDLDTQLRELVGFLDTMRIEQATLAGFSASGGKVIRFARVYPSRVKRLVIFDSVYSYIAPGLEERMSAAIARRIGGRPNDSLEHQRRFHEAWELGAWSAAMGRNLRETFTVSPEGALKALAPPEWWTAFRMDMEAGLYFETQISHPALMFFAVDLDQERLKQFDEMTRAELRPLAVETDGRRRDQIQAFRKNGAHVRIMEMTAAAHYCFVHKPQEVIRAMRDFLEGQSFR